MNRSFILLICLLTGCTRTPETIELSGPTMGTTYSIKVASPPATIDRTKLLTVIDDVLQRVDQQMSAYRDDSEISRFNRSQSTDWFDVSPEFAAVIAAAARVSEQSQGALDVTVAPLVNLWGMGPAGELREVPDAQKIAEVRANVGWRRLQVRESPAALRKDIATLTVDVNGVAPGYAVDLIAQRFATLGVTNFMIDIGGEVRAQGRNAQGELWRIAVERPVDAEPEPYAIVKLDNISITTSGEYRHYVMRDGHRYSHTIDPRTGRPVEHALASVVVIQPNSLDADAWATALNVLGEEEGFRLANERGIPAMFIVATGSGFQHRMTPQYKPYLAVAPR